MQKWQFMHNNKWLTERGYNGFAFNECGTGNGHRIRNLMRNTHGMTLDELARVAVCPLKAKHMEH